MRLKKLIKKKRKAPARKRAKPDIDQKSLKPIQSSLTRNKKTFTAYNNFRKELFAELAPADSTTILFLLPWLISVNHPQCPGYIKDQKRPFRVYGVESLRGIRGLEKDFKKRFDIKKRDSLLTHTKDTYVIPGTYTIGSVGSVSQTSSSDCDMWVCIDRNQFDKTAWRQLNQKINLIKDWMDINCKMPVFFFISDIKAIRECRFGSVDEESSGSTQQRVLKEEFYRTCMVICGKIPLWWLSYHPGLTVDYHDALAVIQDEDFGEYDLVDFGDIERIEKNEYFGAALWQFKKSLSRPLKSIIKMSLLKMLLDAPDESLMCHRFREQVLTAKDGNFPDFSVFTMESIAEDYKVNRPELLKFLIECLYIRCEYNPYNRNQPLKNRLAGPFFKPFKISNERQVVLRKSDTWKFSQQIELGDNLFKLMIELYREISASQKGIHGESDKRDLTILGRKIAAFYSKKKYKVPILQKPTGTLNISNPSLGLRDNKWFVFSGKDTSRPLCSSPEITFNIAFIVWNGLFNPGQISMVPNMSDITLREIVNLGIRMERIFETYEMAEIDYTGYLSSEYVEKLFVIAGLEKTPWFKEKLDLRVVYMNCWGELFARHFRSHSAFEKFILACRRENPRLQVRFYIRRSNTTYEKIIERAKMILKPAIDPES